METGQVHLVHIFNTDKSSPPFLLLFLLCVVPLHPSPLLHTVSHPQHLSPVWLPFRRAPPCCLRPPPRPQNPASLSRTLALQSANGKLTPPPPHLPLSQALCLLSSCKRWSLTVGRRPPPPSSHTYSPPARPPLSGRAECREGRSSQLGCRSNKEGESIGHAMEPRCCHSSRRLPDSHHSSCSMRQQIGK